MFRCIVSKALSALVFSFSESTIGVLGCLTEEKGTTETFTH